jgi:hypothetical protein
MAQTQSRRLGSMIGPLQIAIIALVVITALIHLQRGLGMLGGGPGGGFGGGPGGGPPPGANGGPGGPPPGAGGGFNIMQLIPLPLPVLFLINGIGYLVLVTALYLPGLRQYQQLIRWLLIAFVAVTIVMYLLIAGLRPNPLGLFDKAVEIALIVLLLVEDRRAARATRNMSSSLTGA